MSDNSILCYGVALKKQLQPETLTQALDQLILYNEMLQVRLENGRYMPEPETAVARSDKLLSIYDGTGKSPAEIETLTGQILENLAGEMSGERGASIRAALLNFDQGSNQLFLLSHRAIVDGRGTVLILEDLYRIYEQLSSGKKVALRPIPKTYLEFIREAAAKGTEFSEPAVAEATGMAAATQRKTASFSIVLDKNVKRRLFSWRIAEFEVASVEILAGALLGCLVRAGQGKPIQLWVKSDYRFADETLKYAAGTLTQTYQLQSDFVKERELFSNPKKFRGILRDIPLSGSPSNSPQFSPSSNADWRLRLNLEYLTDEPWLGGDEWAPEGFLMTGNGRAAAGYAVEVTPFISSDRIEIFVEYQETPAVKAFVDKFAADMIPELETVLRYCEGYGAAKEFWGGEFAKAPAQTKIEVESGNYRETDRGRASLMCRIDKSVIDRALLNLGLDRSPLFLAAFSVLISRLNGQEDLALLYLFEKDQVNTVFPLRLSPASNSGFNLFAEQVNHKLRQASALAQYAFDILREEQTRRGQPSLALDLGYSYKQWPVDESLERPATSRLDDRLSFHQDPDLVLEISERDGDLEIRFVYEKSCFSAEFIEGLGVYLNTALESVAADATIRLGDIELEKHRNDDEIADTLSKDDFNF